MAQAKWTRSAQVELEDIVCYITLRDNRRETARKIYNEIKEKCEFYAKNPEMGLSRPDLCRMRGDVFRSFTHKRWVVVYEPRDYGIEVMAVLDGSRRYESYFRRPSDIE